MQADAGPRRRGSRYSVAPNRSLNRLSRCTHRDCLVALTSTGPLNRNTQRQVASRFTRQRGVDMTAIQLSPVIRGPRSSKVYQTRHQSCVTAQRLAKTANCRVIAIRKLTSAHNTQTNRASRWQRPRNPADIKPIMEVCLVEIALSVLNQAVKAESHDQHPENQESSKSSRAHCDRE